VSNPNLFINLFLIYMINKT